MKAITKIGLAVIMLVCVTASASYAQNTADLFIENAHVTGGQYYWEIHITPTSDWGTGNRKALGDCSWYFLCNLTALSNPVLTYAAPQVDPSEGYTNTVGIYGGKVGVTTDLDTDLYDGVNLDQGTKYHIYTVRMDIDDPSQEAHLFWNEVDTGIFNARDASVVASYFGDGDIPLPVELSSFTAEAGDGRVTLTWKTESEMANLGFHIYRSLSEEGEYERITAELIEAAGTATNRSEYTFTDPNVTNGITYWYKLEDVAFDGTRTMHGAISVTPQIKEEVVAARPDAYALSLCYPNPFNPSTTIGYQLPEPGEVRLAIYDVLGQEVRVLVSQMQPAGWYRVNWDGRDEAGRRVSSGMYLYRLEVGADFVQTRKAMFLR